MSCTVLENEKGEVMGFVCGGSWGMGVTDYGPDDGEEFRYVYGLNNPKDPHDFEPDYECNTKQEIENWKAAKAACNCGRELDGGSND